MHLRRSEDKVVLIVIALVLLVGLLLAGALDKQDAYTQQHLYCRMVRTHRWPDYNHDYATTCPCVVTVKSPARTL